jgi:hypothetical protein
MSSTPLWVPLVVAGMGVAGTLAGGIIGSVLTQRRADRREEKAWARERERQRALWAREDEARTFEHRREAYIEFYVAVKAMRTLADDDAQLPDDWGEDAEEKLRRLQFYADRELADVASEAYDYAWAIGALGDGGDPSNSLFQDRQRTYGEAELKMLELMRNRLAIPEGDTKLPLPGSTARGFLAWPDQA